jgi:transposase
MEEDNFFENASFDIIEQIENTELIENTPTRIENSNRAPCRPQSYHRITNDTRSRIIDAFQNGYTRGEIIAYERHPKNTINTIISNFIKSGIINPKQRGGPRHRKIIDKIKEFIRETVDSDCNLSLRIICSMVFEIKNVSVSTTSVVNCLKNLHYSLKVLLPIPIQRN